MSDTPCPSCPWRLSNEPGGANIPNFSIDLMRLLTHAAGLQAEIDEWEKCDPHFVQQSQELEQLRAQVAAHQADRPHELTALRALVPTLKAQVAERSAELARQFKRAEDADERLAVERQDHHLQVATLEAEREAHDRLTAQYENRGLVVREQAQEKTTLRERAEAAERHLAELTAVVTAHAAAGEYSPEQVLVLARSARADSDRLDDVRDQLAAAERQIASVRHYAEQFDNEQVLALLPASTAGEPAAREPERAP